MAKIEEEIICPNCGSDNVSMPRYSKWMYFILIFLLFIPLPYFRGKCHCFECGYDFKKKEADSKSKEIPPSSE